MNVNFSERLLDRHATQPPFGDIFLRYGRVPGGNL